MKNGMTYNQCIIWISENVDPRCFNISKIKEEMAVKVVSDQFGISQLQIAIDVVNNRVSRAS